MKEVTGLDYLTAGVKLMEAVEGLNEHVRRPLERLSAHYFSRGCDMLAPIVDEGAAATASIIQGE